MYDEALETLRKDTENLQLEIRVLKEKLAGKSSENISDLISEDAQKQAPTVDTSKSGIPTELVNSEVSWNWKSLVTL